MICMPCGLAADMLALARDEQQHVADVRSGDDLRWLAPVAALILELHQRCAQSGGCDCQHRVGTSYLPGEQHLTDPRVEKIVVGDAVAAFMDACVAEPRLHEFDVMFADRMIRTTASVR